MITNPTGTTTQRTSSEHAGRPRAVAAIMLLASLGPMALLVIGVFESRTNPWAVMTIWFAVLGVLLFSLPLIAISVGILRRRTMARWLGIAVAALGGLGAAVGMLLVTLADGVPQGDAWFFSILLATAAALCGFMVWALATAPGYFEPKQTHSARLRGR